MLGMDDLKFVFCFLLSYATRRLRYDADNVGLRQTGPGKIRQHNMTNPRFKNGNLRRKHRARFKALGAPCGICKGQLGPIHYDEPSDAAHPLSFVIDEIRPVSKWRLFGYDSAAAAAQDWDNLQAAHYWCNAKKGAKTSFTITPRAPVRRDERDGEW